MNLYETTFIINPQTDDATIDRHVRDVADVITRNQGQIRYEDHMGTRRLAYEIQGLTQGYYASFIFEAPTGVLPQLERHFKLNEQYIRHLTVRFEGDLDKLLQRSRPETERVEAPPEPKAPEPKASEPVENSEKEDTAVEEKEVEEPAADFESDTAEIPTVSEPSEPEAADADDDVDGDKDDQEL